MAITQAAGAYFTDADGKRYLDYHAAFGPLIPGHNHPAVNAAVRAAMERLDLTGAGVSDLEVKLAETIARHVPSAERVLLCNSGSEATYAALRLARAVTGRTSIIKFQGTYHGWHDAVLMNVISPPAKLGHKDPLSLGMLAEVIEHTIVLPFNDSEAVAETLQRQGHEIIGCGFMLPTALKRNHVSAAHTWEDIEFTLETARRVLRTMPASIQ